MASLMVGWRPADFCIQWFRFTPEYGFFDHVRYASANHVNPAIPVFSIEDDLYKTVWSACLGFPEAEKEFPDVML